MTGSEGQGTPGPPTLEDVLRALDADRAGVEAVARAAVGSGSGRLVDWAVTPLGAGGAGNPTTGGLFRVTGHVTGHVPRQPSGQPSGPVAGPDPTPPPRSPASRDAARPVPWSAVLKVVRSPVETEWPSDVPDEGIYWRREVELARSHLLDGVRGLVPPRTLATVERPAASAWLWMEDLGAPRRPEWSDGDYVLAARAVARFHAPYLTGAPVPDLPWLSSDFTRRFHAHARPYHDRIMGAVRAGIPAFAPLDPRTGDPALAALHRVMTDPEPLLSALDGTPQVLSHGDLNVDNLVLRTRADGGREVVALDWQMAGPASIGCDLGQLLAGARPADPEARGRTVSAVLAAYHDELRAAGADVDAEVVALARAADAAVRQTAWAFFALHLAVTRAGPLDDDAAAAHVADVVRAATTTGLADLARQALDLVGRA